MNNKCSLNDDFTASKPLSFPLKAAWQQFSKALLKQHFINLLQPSNSSPAAAHRAQTHTRGTQWEDKQPINLK